MIDIQTAKVSDFEDCLDQVFATDVGENHIELILSGCRLSQFGPHDGNERTRHPFALTFTGEGQPQLNQGTYTLKNESLGAAAIFLVPIGMGRYEAIFN